ncbi:MULTISPECIES: lantibiotic dehydratase [Streptomyces]|uniref:Lantibiotic dehydratase n=1 Tax=Streptomyces tsukubensis (strain DSM 42081 / NBRC 108919 / NRRL 18488 / 9993) TaxID=1114943 RepID=I2N875_STRT9|nr:lantibiotic dehydratase [Streptomyces tsukubensis]MYS67971.1 lantibiotic dehydratase [Streptomyces sp. SID5473]AZK97094.1 lantibiotic dehydratase [Streptomyces tsukubensis]EIF93222.1 lantibiotic dehydratase-like protein [Streptomyces tsukubensis NRRL18488]QKM66935.1 lantibiotic dehydratase [Streptomyces tsukubensis NRRL18488]TAI44718.1 lantibiotic dehydratase [Streptomyces tsukubensis]
MYAHVDAALLRAGAWDPDELVQPWPDPGGDADSWRAWLERTLRIPGFAEALEQASPALARRVRDIRDEQDLPERVVRKAMFAVLRYLLRASSRATPFGFFAGVAPVSLADAATVRIGSGHRAVVRADAVWLTTVIERLEADRALLPRLMVRTHSLVAEKDGHWVLDHRGTGGSGGAPARVEVRATSPVTSALATARHPIRVTDLAAKLAGDFPRVPAEVIAKLLADLIAQRLLVTNLRAPMTTTNPLNHLLNALDAAEAGNLQPAGATVARLRSLTHALARPHTSPEYGEQRAQLTAEMRHIAPGTAPVLRTDLRIDGEATVPTTVADEAARAATALVRLARQPFLSRAWANWHSRFLERYGPRALVPVLNAVDGDTGIGYPAGFLGGPPAPASAPLTERDGKLLALAQNAALRRQHEIVVDDAMINVLTLIGPDIGVQPTTELIARINAASTDALGDGEFTLAVTGVSRTAGTVTGRFLHLLDADDRERMAKAYATAATATDGALPVQISVPPLHASTENVARAPAVMPAVLVGGECHKHTGERVLLDDIAVTADVHRLYLVSRSRRRPLEFVTLNAVEPVHRTHPLVRFLAEATHAMGAPCAVFDWGAATTLPYLPAVRYGRTILSPARWLLTAADLADREADQPRWDSSLAAWREQVAVPSTVYVGDGDQRLRLDLDEPAHRVLLRAQVQRSGTAVLRVEAAPDAGWIGGRPHELVIPLARTGPGRRAPWWLDRETGTSDGHGHFPGCDGRFHFQLYARPERHGGILGRLPELLSEIGGTTRWWFLPYRDPDEHLRLRLVVPADHAEGAPAAIGGWTRALRRAGLISRVRWDTDFPETARFGGPAAIDAAEAFFAADSEAAAAQLAASTANSGLDAQAVTATSMIDLTTGLLGNSADAMAWLIHHARTTSTAPTRGVYEQAVALGNPYGHDALTRYPGGERIAAAWAQRRETLAGYRAVLDTAGTTDVNVLLPELLHLHHTRVAGIDLDAEGQCLHLARAAALSWTARGRTRS